MYHTQLDELTVVARAHPDATIVLNHVGGAIGIGPYAGRRDEVFAEWRQSIIELARCPNVHIKLGGLGMRLFGFDVHSYAQPPSSEQLAQAWRPYIETCIEQFGPQARDVREQLPGGQGQLQLSVAVECVQAHRGRHVECGQAGAVQRNGDARVSPRLTCLSFFLTRRRLIVIRARRCVSATCASRIL